MCDDIGLRELAALAAGVAASEASLQVLKEARIEINLVVDRAVERTHGGLRKPAARLGGSGKHHQSWWLVLLSRLSKNSGPLHFGATEHGRNEVAHGIGWSPGAASI